jgi:hypothetical protein
MLTNVALPLADKYPHDQGKLISDRAASAVMVLIQNAKSIQI